MEDESELGEKRFVKKKEKRLKKRNTIKEGALEQPESAS